MSSSMAAIELALDDEIGNRRPERTGGAFQAAGQPLPPARFGSSRNGNRSWRRCVSRFARQNESLDD